MGVLRSLLVGAITGAVALGGVSGVVTMFFGDDDDDSSCEFDTEED